MPDNLPKLEPGPIERAIADKLKAARLPGQIGGPGPGPTSEEREAIAAERSAAQREWLRANETPAQKKAREAEEKFAAELAEGNRKHAEKRAAEEAARQATRDAELKAAMEWKAARDKAAADEAVILSHRAALAKGDGRL